MSNTKCYALHSRSWLKKIQSTVWTGCSCPISSCRNVMYRHYLYHYIHSEPTVIWCGRIQQNPELPALNYSKLLFQPWYIWWMIPTIQSHHLIPRLLRKLRNRPALLETFTFFAISLIMVCQYIANLMRPVEAWKSSGGSWLIGWTL